MTTRKIIVSNKAPKPVGPYNQAVLLDNILYVSGCLGLGPDMKLVEGGVTAQAKQAFANLGYILEEAGSSYDKVIKTVLLLDDINDFAPINEIYKEVFKTNYPARSTFQAGKLPMNAKFEIEAVAVVGDVITINLNVDQKSCVCAKPN